MELKDWNDYTPEEKEALLRHLFIYYGKYVYSLEELEMFDALIKEAPDKIFEIFLHSNVIKKNGQPIILEALRKNDKPLINLKAEIKKYKEEDIEEYKKFFLTEIVNTFNNKAPSIPLSKEEFDRQLKRMFNNKND